MQVELYIDGEKKLFSVPFIPMLAKRKYLEIMAKAEEKGGTPTFKQQLDEDDKLVSVLADVVFKGQFTVAQVYEGASGEYVYKKLHEAIFGIKEEVDEGNEVGE